MDRRLSESDHFQQPAIEYLDVTGTLECIKKKCIQYQCSQERTYQFHLPISTQNLLELNANLGNLVLNHPAEGTRLFQEVVFSILSALDLLPGCKSLCQVVVNLKVDLLPKFTGYHLSSTSHFINLAKRKRFIHYEGIVFSLSEVHSYTKCARFLCSADSCEGSTGDHFIRLHIPGARETQVIRNDFACSFCGAQLVEDISCRVLGQKLTVELVDSETCKNPICGVRYQCLTVYLRDELVREVTIGQMISVIGIPVMDLDCKIFALEANNVSFGSGDNAREDKIKLDMTPPQKSVTCTPPKESVTCTPDFKILPDGIRLLYEDRSGSAWSFTLGLAFAFAGHITPVGTFLHLKLGLLLSLVGSLSQCKGGLDILAVCTDQTCLVRLLQYGASLANRSITHSSLHPLTASVTKSKHNSGRTVIEGGSLLLANDGVCIIPCLENLKKPVKEILFQVLESDDIRIDVPKGNSHDGQQQVHARKCKIWATLDLANTVKHQNADGIEPCPVWSKKPVDKSLVDAFGIVFFADISHNTYAEHLLMQQTIMHAMEYSAQPLIAEEEFKQFLKTASAIKVTFTSEAEWLIKGYYVASRRVRSEENLSQSMPVTAVKTLTSLSEAHAKLSLSEEVTEFNAVMAVFLYEESLCSRSGHSVLNVKPTPHVNDDNFGAYIGPEMDQKLVIFRQQLSLFILNHAPDLDMSTWVEE